MSSATQGGATCTTCPLRFHKGCVGIPDSAATPGEWTCPDCRKKTRKGDNSDTPIKDVCGTIAPRPSIDIDEALSNRARAHPASSAEETDVQAMRRELAQHIAEQREFQNELRVSIARMAERIDGFERRLEVVESKEATSIKTTQEVAELQQTVSQLKLELNDREQENLWSDLDIGHLPEEKHENLVHNVTVIAAKLGVTIESRDIVFAERIGVIGVIGAVGARGGGGEGGEAAGGRPRRVVVRLVRRRLRDELLGAARVRRNLTTADISLVGPPRRIYINERLTRTNRQLFHRVREECRKHQWRYSWTRKGRVFARQGDGKPAFSIRSDADILRVFGVDLV